MLQIAVAASLLLHLVGAALTWRLPLVPVADQARVQPAEDVVEMILEPASEAEDERSYTYVSVPERLASEEAPPDDDLETRFLALHHSLAADNKLGDGVAPSAPESGPGQQLAIRRENLESGAGVAYAPLPVYRDARAAVPRSEEARPRNQEVLAAGPDGARALPLPTETQDTGPETQEAKTGESEQTPVEEWWEGQAPSILREGERVSSGDRGFQFDQTAEGMVTSGVARMGEYTLNTWDWTFAPWLEAFGNSVRRHWNLPPARRMGLISGETVLMVMIERSGTIRSVEILETVGHESLHDSSHNALVAAAPYAPLPADFPLDHLEIRLTMGYPEPRR